MSYTISGYIKDDINNVLSGITITLSGDASSSTTSNSLGYYEFTSLNSGNYIITPSSATLFFISINKSITLNSNNTNVNFIGTSYTILSKRNRQNKLVKAELLLGNYADANIYGSTITTNSDSSGYYGYGSRIIDGYRTQLDNFWQGDIYLETCWNKIDLTSIKKLNRIEIYFDPKSSFYSGVNTRVASAFKIQYSIDDANWTVWSDLVNLSDVDGLGTLTITNGIVSSNTKSYCVFQGSSEISARYIRIIYTGAVALGAVRVCEIELYRSIILSEDSDYEITDLNSGNIFRSNQNRLIGISLDRKKNDLFNSYETGALTITLHNIDKKLTPKYSPSATEISSKGFFNSDLRNELRIILSFGEDIMGYEKWKQVGEFYIYNIKNTTSNKVCVLQCYDILKKLQEDNIPIDLPNLNNEYMQSILEYLCMSSNISADKMRFDLGENHVKYYQPTEGKIWTEITELIRSIPDNEFFVNEYGQLIHKIYYTPLPHIQSHDAQTDFMAGTGKTNIDLMTTPGAIRLKPTHCTGGLLTNEVWSSANDLSLWQNKFSWFTNEIDSIKPTLRYGAMMAFDSNANKIVMFGGYNGTDYLWDLWVFDCTSNTWELKSVDPYNKPDIRAFGAFVFSTSDNKFYLYGGVNATGNLDDTWSYDLSTNLFESLSPASPPSARKQMACAYDASVNKMIIFGGYIAAATDETWAYDITGNTWTNKAPVTKPEVRYLTACCYVPTIGITHNACIYVHGGYDGTTRYRDFWRYKEATNTWTQMSVTNEDLRLARYGMQMIYNSTNGYIYCWSGRTTLPRDSASLEEQEQDMWIISPVDLSWGTITPEYNDKPTPRNYYAMSYDSNSKKIIIFGGQLSSDDTITNDMIMIEPFSSKQMISHRFEVSTEDFYSQYLYLRMFKNSIDAIQDTYMTLSSYNTGDTYANRDEIITVKINPDILNLSSDWIILDFGREIKFKKDCTYSIDIWTDNNYYYNDIIKINSKATSTNNTIGRTYLITTDIDGDDTEALQTLDIAYKLLGKYEATGSMDGLEINCGTTLSAWSKFESIIDNPDIAAITIAYTTKVATIAGGGYDAPVSVNNNENIASALKRYLVYSIAISSTDKTQTPIIYAININYQSTTGSVHGYLLTEYEVKEDEIELSLETEMRTIVRGESDIFSRATVKSTPLFKQNGSKTVWQYGNKFIVFPGTTNDITLQATFEDRCDTSTMYLYVNGILSTLLTGITVTFTKYATKAEIILHVDDLDGAYPIYEIYISSEYYDTIGTIQSISLASLSNIFKYKAGSYEFTNDYIYSSLIAEAISSNIITKYSVPKLQIISGLEIPINLAMRIGEKILLTDNWQALSAASYEILGINYVVNSTLNGFEIKAKLSIVEL